MGETLGKPSAMGDPPAETVRSIRFSKSALRVNFTFTKVFLGNSIETDPLFLHITGSR